MDKRVRGRTLQKIRSEHFRRFPLCVTCQAAGRVTVATELDHIKPLHQGGKDVPENRQSICTSCHLRKSKTERGHEYRPKVTIGIDGYPK